MKRSRLLLLLAVVLMALLGTWYFGRAARDGLEVESPAPASTPEAASTPGELAAPTRDDGIDSRSQAALPAKPATSSEPRMVPTKESTKLVSGRVFDTRGNSLGGLALALHDSPQKEIARSSADGSFEFELPSTLGRLSGESRFGLEVAPGQRWTSACGTPFTSEDCANLLVVAAPSIELGGIVEDEHGAPADSARISMKVSSRELREFPLQLDRNSSRELSTRSARDGTFHLSSVPAIADNLLVASLGKVSIAVKSPVSTTLDLRIRLRVDGEPDAKPRIEGIVLSAQGQPAAEAVVMLGSSSTMTDNGGHFELSKPDWSANGRLFAVKPGFQPAFENIQDRVVHSDSSPIVLRLGPEALEIRGRVVLADEEPAKGWQVALVDPTELTQSQVPPLIAENLAAGLDASNRNHSTNAKGEFALSGLSARAYGVKAWNTKSLLSLQVDAVQAGTHDLVLRVPADATWPEIRGIVVDRRGAPLPKVDVELRMVTFKSGGAQSWISTKAVATSADGSFRLTNVPRRGVSLSLGGDSVIDKQFDMSELHPESELRLTAELRCHFRIVRNRADGKSDTAEVLDADGESISIFTFQNGGWGSSSQVRVPDQGSTHVFAVSDRAQTVVIHRGAEEIARIPLNLLPGQVAEVRY